MFSHEGRSKNEVLNWIICSSSYLFETHEYVLFGNDFSKTVFYFLD